MHSCFAAVSASMETGLQVRASCRKLRLPAPTHRQRFEFTRKLDQARPGSRMQPLERVTYRFAPDFAALRYHALGRTCKPCMGPPLSRVIPCAVTILMGSDGAFTSLSAQTNRRPNAGVPENFTSLRFGEWMSRPVQRSCDKAGRAEECLLEPLSAATSAIPARRRPTTEEFETASTQGSSAVR